MKLPSPRTIGLAGRVGVSAVAAILVLALAAAGPGASAAPPADPAPDKPKAPPEKPKPKLGLLVNDPKAAPGYTLIASIMSNRTYLVDTQGHVVQAWKSDYNPGQSAYLLENGNLFRPGQVKDPAFTAGGAGGRVQEVTWDGKLLWDYTCSSDTQLSHHDACRLPNGNVLLIVWERKPAKDVVAAGRRPETVGDNRLMADSILEVQPTGPTTGKVVWEWHAWDHLIQDFDDKKAHFGDVAAHPELIDVNFGEGVIAAMVAKPEELDKLRAIGYVGGAGRKPARVQPDWTHVNSIAYNADLDQIMLSVHEFGEIWIIDHSTKTAESASHSGGRYGKGGDLLYRWGNPRAHRAGAVKDQKLFGQHNAHWIPKGLPGEGHVLIFNNGMRRTGGAYSSVDEIVLPVDSRGRYLSSPGKAFGPEKAIWSYAAPKRTDFFAAFISGAQRLANGNTLICSGPSGTVFEVTPKDEVVWKYVNPAKGGSPIGVPPMGGPPKLGQMLPSFIQGPLNLTAEQKKQLEAVEKDAGEKLGKVLTDDQKKLFAERPMGFNPKNIPQPGQLLASGVQERMKLTEEQKKQLADIQKEVDGKLDTLLKDEQKKQFKEMKDGAKGFLAGPPGGMAGFGGPGGGSSLFRALRYAPDYPGLAGKELKPGKTIDEFEAALPKDPPKEPKDKSAP